MTSKERLSTRFLFIEYFHWEQGPQSLLLASLRKNFFSTYRSPPFVIRKVRWFIWWINLRQLTRHPWLISAFLALRSKMSAVETHHPLLLLVGGAGRGRYFLFGVVARSNYPGLLATCKAAMMGIGVYQMNKPKCHITICSLSIAKAIFWLFVIIPFFTS